jgi:hypothetical protein
MMDKIVSYIATPLVAVATGAMVHLFGYNSENYGVLFGLAMVALPLVTTLALIYHYYVNWIKK